MTEKTFKEMVQYFGKDVRRVNHAVKVHGFAMVIASGENMDAETSQTLALAALLHDIGIHEAERKHGSTAGKYQELEGPPIARDILSRIGVSDLVIDRVCYLVGHHHSYSIGKGNDFQVLIEADFLVNIFEDAMGKEAIESILRKYFSTETGKYLLKTMYL